MTAETYSTGLPCKHGHLADRYVSSKACCECDRLKHKKYKDANVDKVQAQGAAWRAANPGYKSPNEAESAQRYYERNKEKCAIRTSTHRKNNLEQYALYRRQSRARIKAVGGSHTLDDVREIFKMQKGKCAYCKTKVTLETKHVDHIQPIVRGGHNGRSNLQILCESCNLRKNAIEPLEFARRIGRLL